MTIEHLAIAVALRLNVFIVITKVDDIVGEKASSDINCLLKLYDKLSKLFSCQGKRMERMDSIARVVAHINRTEVNYHNSNNNTNSKTYPQKSTKSFNEVRFSKENKINKID